MWFGAGLAFLCLLVATFATDTPTAVALFGLRTNFLHLPLIFIMPKVFDIKDVQAVGRWALVLAVPMALLMALQFRSAPESWINAGANEAFGQITSAMGRIRPPGTFSFISGPVYFFALVTVFLLQSQLSNYRYPQLLFIAAALATLTASAVSGSRSLLANVAIVMAFGFFACAILRPRLLWRWGRSRPLWQFSFTVSVTYLYLVREWK
jgi:hypothetical protein